MGRSHVKPIRQPNDYTCGPTALKHALAILGTRHSLRKLTKLCQTNSHNGTSTKHMVAAMNKLGVSVLAHEKSTLTHIRSALRSRIDMPRAVMVSYLYHKGANGTPHPESGHWATVASYKPSTASIVLLDSSSGTRKSYPWREFRSRWIDYDIKRYAVSKGKKKFRFVRHWQPQLMLVLAQNPRALPKFRTPRARLFTP